MTARDIELALVSCVFPYRLWVVVPRVSWGLGMRECDLLAVSMSGYAQSVEIKVSVGDLKREWKKRHHVIAARYSNPAEAMWIKCKWFAVPASMREQTLAFVPEEYGVLVVDAGSLPCSEKVVRARLPKPNREALPWPIQKRYELARNGVIKYWYHAWKDDERRRMQESA